MKLARAALLLTLAQVAGPRPGQYWRTETRSQPALHHDQVASFNCLAHGFLPDGAC